MNAEQYLAAVELELGDLPWRVRKSLAADLRLHLDEVPAGEDLVQLLGAPSTYAGEMRAAAELGPRRGPVAFVRARRPRDVVIAAVLVALAGVTVGTVVWASHYQPLGTGNVGLNPPISRQGALGETVAPYLNGKPFQYGVSLLNSGRVPVRILDLPIDPQQKLPWRVRPYMVTSETNYAKRPEPFRPFTLKPGHQRLILFRGAYANCRFLSAGSGVTVNDVRVRERVLLWTHTVPIDLSGPLVVRMPPRKSPCATG